MRRKSLIKLFCLIIVLLMLIYCVVQCDSKLRVLINNYAHSRAKILSNSVINETVLNYLENNKIHYKEIVCVNNDGGGNVTSVEFDTVLLTKIKSAIISLIQSNINKTKSIVMKIPIGSLSGNQILNNRGPKIRIELDISSAVYSKIASEFISAGINQTLHRITLTVSTDIFFIMPWYRSSGGYQTEFVLAETIIVGKVPDAYTNVIEYPGSNIAGEIFDYSAETD